MELTVLEEIVRYQVANRQIGHTSLMLKGFGKYLTDFEDGGYLPLIVVGNMTQKDHMSRQLVTDFNLDMATARDCVTTVGQIKNGYLKGIYRRPLVIDNIGLFELALDLNDNRKQLMEEFMKVEKHD